MAELAPSGGGPNRLFAILALGLGGLLILGLLGVGGFFLIQRFAAPAPPAPTAVRAAANTPTRVVVPTATVQPTSTELPSPTFVVVAAATTQTPGGVSAGATVTGTVGAGTGTPTSGLPNTGLGEDLLLLGGGVVLVLIVFAARHARSTGAA